MRSLLVILFLITLISTSGNTQSRKKLLFENATYEEEIRTVQLYPEGNSNAAVLEPAVLQLGRGRLILEFDDLVQNPEDYKARIIHCNKNWTESRLSNIDFLYDYNEFNINNDFFSVNTKVRYIHYRFRLPQVKLPGNYLLVVYRGNNASDIVLSQRFMVYTNKVNIKLTSTLNGLTSSNRLNQQLDFVINYENYEIVNPLETVAVTLRQNERWDNALTDLKPSFIRDYANELEYRFFNFENNFLAGNEYRFFDMRSLRNPGAGVQSVDWNAYPISVKVMADQPLLYQAYTHRRDINGDYYIVNVDAGDGDTNSDYVNTTFTLVNERPFPGEVYVVGKMNNWNLKPENKMKYNPKQKSYTADLILKQGFYNYKYYLKNDSLNYNYLEGNHFQAENTYEIFVYHRPLNMRTDLLIGYGYYQMNRID